MTEQQIELLAAMRERKMSDYKLVPVEPTADIVEAFKAMWFLGFCDDRMAKECYAAIMNAAPAVQGEPSRESLMVVLERDEYGKPAVWCDPEIADLVSALNGSGVRTIASCSGHGKRPGNIVLADGRELVIARSFEESRIVDSIFQGINGEPARAVVVPKTAVQGEPVGWQFYQAGKWWHGDDRIKDHRKNTEEAGFRVRDVYAAPQTAEKQTASELLEALQEMVKMASTGMVDFNPHDEFVMASARAALAKARGES